MKPTYYDKQDVYAEKILPLVRQVSALCSAIGIPAFMAFAVSNAEDGTHYERHVVHGASRQILKEDSIRTLLLRINGFDVEYPGSIMKAISTLENYESEMHSRIHKTAIGNPPEEDLADMSIEPFSFDQDGIASIETPEEIDDYDWIVSGKMEPNTSLHKNGES